MTKIEEARNIMKDAFESDSEEGGLKDAYISNIAMLLQDKYEVINYNNRNQAAEDILKLIFY